MKFFGPAMAMAAQPYEQRLRAKVSLLGAYVGPLSGKAVVVEVNEIVQGACDTPKSGGGTDSRRSRRRVDVPPEEPR